MSFSTGPGTSPRAFRKLGFTLLEVLIGSSLLSVMIFMVWLFVPRALALEKQLELRDYAETLARNQALALREEATGQATLEVTGPEGVRFVVNSQVQNLNEDLKEGMVEVRWTHREKQQSVMQKTRWLGVGFP